MSENEERGMVEELISNLKQQRDELALQIEFGFSQLFVFARKWPKSGKSETCPNFKRHFEFGSLVSS